MNPTKKLFRASPFAMDVELEQEDQEIFLLTVGQEVPRRVWEESLMRKYEDDCGG